MNKLVSIIVPVYNAEKSIANTINSVIVQNYLNWELILIDDGSTDKSLEICRSFEKTDDRIKVIHIDNSGVSVARNVGLDNCNGEMFMFLDSDDFLNSSALQICMHKIGDADIIIFGIETFPKTSYISVEKTYNFCRMTDMVNEFETLYKASVFNSPCNKIYRNKNRLVRFDSNYSLGEDLLFNLQYLENCDGIIIIPDVLYYYRRLNTGSLSYKVDANALNIQKALKIAIDAAFNYEAKIDEVTTYFFIKTMMDKIYSILYKENLDKKEKKTIITEWAKEKLLYSNNGRKLRIRAIDKFVLLLLKNKHFDFVYYIAKVRKKISSFYHMVWS